MKKFNVLKVISKVTSWLIKETPKIIVRCFGILFCAIFFRLLWNANITIVFDVSEISYQQSVSILIMCWFATRWQDYE